MLRIVNDLIRGTLFHNFAGVEHDDMIGDLRHQGEVVGHVDRGRVLLPDNLFEGLEHFDLRGDVERGGRLVKHHQVGSAAERHRRHQALQLTARYLVRVTVADAIGIGQFQRVVEFYRAFVGFFLGQATVQYGGLGDLLVDRDRRVEGRRRALREVGDVAAAQIALCERRHAQHVLAEEATFPPEKNSPGLV